MKKNSLVYRCRLKMISRKAIYAIISIAIYAILITAYLKIPKDLFKVKDEDKKCNSKSPCIRFCLKEVNNRTNSFLFDLFNQTRLSKRKPNGITYVLDVDGSDDDTEKKKEEEENKKKYRKKGDPNTRQDTPDYGTADYTYDEFGREQKMKTKPKREVKALEEFQDQDQDFDDIMDEPLTQNLIVEKTTQTTTKLYDYENSENTSVESVGENSTEFSEISIKILRTAPKCIARVIEDAFYDFRLLLVSMNGDFL